MSSFYSNAYVTNGVEWTPEEDAILREHYEDIGAVGCIELLPGRTAKSIQTRTRRLGIRFLNYNCPEVGHREYAAFMREQDKKFCQHMMKFPDERPSNYYVPRNGAGGQW